jgi:hypothetical protein
VKAERGVEKGKCKEGSKALWLWRQRREKVVSDGFTKEEARDGSSECSIVTCLREKK